MPTTTDPDAVCLDTLATVARELDIDAAWTVDEGDHGFTWWPLDGLRQRVRVEPGPDTHEAGAVVLTVTTPVWRQADPAPLMQLIADLRLHARCAAVRHVPGSGDLELITRVVLPAEEAPRLARTFAAGGAIQAYLAAWAWQEAERSAGPDAYAWRDEVPHPRLGFRVAPHSVFRYPDRVLEAGTARDAAFLSDLVQGVADALADRGLASGRLHPEGTAAIAAPLPGTIALLELGVLRGPVDRHSLIVTLTIDGDSPHGIDTYGHELQTRLLAPNSGAWTLGSWRGVPRRRGRAGTALAHALFVPLARVELELVPYLADAICAALAIIGGWVVDGAPPARTATLPMGGVRPVRRRAVA
jgi:hypothetical protein